MPADYTHSPGPEEIMEYLDGEGTAASRETIAAHLASCAACQAIAAEQRGISDHAQAWRVGTAPASLRPPAAPRARVLLPLVGAWRPSRFVMAGLTAAAAVLVVISFTARERRAPAATAQSLEFKVEPTSRVEADRRAGRGGIVGGVAGGLPQAPMAGKAPRGGPAQGVNLPESAGALRALMVIRTATLRIVAKEFGGVRATVEGIVSQTGGFIDQMTITGDNSTARELRGTLRVPGDRMAAALTRLRQIGQVVEDTQGSQDVTDQIVDLDARLTSARATEQRLTELLRNRTGKLSDVLEVERELARVRLDIERLDAEKTNMGRRVTYATIDISVAEERKAGLDAGPLSLATRIRIAAADGLESALESVALTVLLLLRAGPTLLLWGTALGIAFVFGRRIMRPSA
jgi:uncharacterized protein DUF4349/putative zinc finger protein